MTKIFEKTRVRVPLASAGAFLSAFLKSHTPAGADDAHIVLQAGDAKQTAVVSVTPAHQYGDMTPRFHIHWTAENAGPFPVFDGELLIASDENYESFELVLEGQYTPPGGLPGAVFDAAVGRHVAHAAARDLLTRTATHIEGLFAEQERGKALRAAATT